MTRAPAPLEVDLRPDFLLGVEHFNSGAWWEAHEAWEDVWKGLKAAARPPDEVLLLQGLIQCAALLYNHRRGTTRGVENQWMKLQAKLSDWDRAWGVDVPALVDLIRPFAEDAKACILPQDGLRLPMVLEDQA